MIAAHRGWKGTPMFREIEALKPGDEVVITNLWGSLKYKVVKTIVIDPTDIDAVKIIADADMLTLITCHPYTKNYQRYVVYCSRMIVAVLLVLLVLFIRVGSDPPPENRENS